MTTTAATQESKVTQNIITTSEVREGDKIAVTLHTTSHEDREHVTTYTGRAHDVEGKDVISGKPVWRTEKGWNLYVHEEGAVIELLDRPEPKIVLPTGTHAVIQYRRGSSLWTGRHDGRGWSISANDMFWDTYSPEALTIMLNDQTTLNPRTDYKVLFEGVAK